MYFILENNPSSLFSEVTMREYIIPKLLSIFSLRDCQIRLILLKYFPSFFPFFTEEQLQIRILPEVGTFRLFFAFEQKNILIIFFFLSC